jgi:hypothetical protein
MDEQAFENSLITTHLDLNLPKSRLWVSAPRAAGKGRQTLLSRQAGRGAQ